MPAQPVSPAPNACLRRATIHWDFTTILGVTESLSSSASSPRAIQRLHKALVLRQLREHFLALHPGIMKFEVVISFRTSTCISCCQSTITFPGIGKFMTTALATWAPSMTTQFKVVASHSSLSSPSTCGSRSEIRRIRSHLLHRNASVPSVRVPIVTAEISDKEKTFEFPGENITTPSAERF